jgi:hypothetical protein
MYCGSAIPGDSVEARNTAPRGAQDTSYEGVENLHKVTSRGPIKEETCRRGSLGKTEAVMCKLLRYTFPLGDAFDSLISTLCQTDNIYRQELC